MKATGHFSSGFRLYLRCWMRSFLPGSHPGAPLTVRRLLFLLGIFPPFLIFQLWHGVSHALDEIFFPDYREVEIRKPVFIAGIPRSGTTFWHRALALNEVSFTTMRSWEVLLAPSVSARKLLRLLSRMDRRLGSPLRRLTDWLINLLAGDFQDVHEVGYRLPEEDYLTLLPDGGCFLMALAFPFEEAFWKLADLDALSSAEQKAWMETYRRNLKKHLYVAGAEKRLLSKNAAFTSWLRHFPEDFPEASYLLCTRDPLSALSSQLSSLQSARRLFGVDPTGEIFAARFLDIYTRNYRRLLELAESRSEDTLVIADMDDLKKSNAAALRRALERLVLPVDPPLQAKLARLDEAISPPGSRHSHNPGRWGFDKSEIDALMGAAYQKLVTQPASLRHED